MDGLDDAGGMLGWPFRDPRWPARLVLMGVLWFLLSLTLVGIPLAGIALAGWMLTAADNLRAGRLELPPPGLYLRRGYRLFLVQLIYLLALLVLAALTVGGGLRLGGIAGGLLAVFGESLLTLGSTALVAATPALVQLTESGGVLAALRVDRLAALLAANPRRSVGDGLLSLLCLDIISPIGLLACGIGLAVTTTYGYAVLAA
ncbi:MAG: DUF4013 domain-containing protein, partial [Candidatus Dormibacteraeota bacterium]|nr:DUF4013 domain-containing protein [Candidatus Dormibacteraeota bacterium]